MMTTKEKIMQLKSIRQQRSEEFNDFIRNPEFRVVLDKLIGFLTDEEDPSIHLKISDANSCDSYTDGKTITLGMLDNFFSSEYGPLDWTIVFKTLLVHEVQHINSSNFEDIKSIAEWYGKLMKTKGISSQLAMRVGKTFLNIMEDGRIENIIVHNLPGFKTALRLVNGEIRRLCGPDQPATEPIQEYVDFQNESLSYCLTGCHAPNIEVYAGSRMEKEFLCVKHYFDEAIDAKTSKECANICRKFLSETADYFAELLQQEDSENQLNDQIGQALPDEYTCNQEWQFNPGNSSSVSVETIPSISSNKKVESDSESEENDSNTDTSFSNNTNSENDTSPDTNNQKSSSNNKRSNSGQNSLRQGITKDKSIAEDHWTDDFSNGNSELIIEDISQEELAALRRGIRDELQVPTNITSKKNNDDPLDTTQYKDEHIRTYHEYFPKIADSPLPQDMEMIGRQMKRTIERILHQKRIEQRNTCIGVLDARSLYRIGLKDPHIFVKRGKPMKAELAVFLLMDNSGSMGSIGAESKEGRKVIYYSKSSLSRIAASYIEYALKDFAAIKISLFDVSCGEIRHQTIKDFDTQTKGGKCYHSINTLGIGGGNKDGFSIRVATKELTKRRESKKVLVILSDGLPSDYNGGEKAGMADVQNAVKETRAKGIITIPIMFGDKVARKRYEKNFEFMYGHFISCDPIDVNLEFQKLLISLVKKS